jgi:hypothetical protein
MQWIKNLFGKRNRSLLGTMVGNSYHREDQRVQEDQRLQSDPLKLNIYQANGGTIVETRTYDHSKDRNHTRLYIITDDEDMGNAISRIIMMEKLH